MKHEGNKKNVAHCAPQRVNATTRGMLHDSLYLWAMITSHVYFFDPSSLAKDCSNCPDHCVCNDLPHSSYLWRLVFRSLVYIYRQST